MDRVELVSLGELLMERDQPLVRVSGPARRTHPDRPISSASERGLAGRPSVRVRRRPFWVELVGGPVLALIVVDEPRVERHSSLLAGVDEVRGEVEVFITGRDRLREFRTGPVEESIAALEVDEDRVEPGLIHPIDVRFNFVQALPRL
ncbi:MAG: hypothetical protein M5U21_06790 [Fimbriimonadaceae bacterium]|nr:hypothetical protein [Fimbriimonadaceae bacterium]